VTVQPGQQPFYFATYAKGNKNLNPEVVHALEGGYTAEIGRHAVTAAIYRNFESDNIDFYPAVYYSATDLPAGWSLPPDQLPVRTLVKLYSYRNVARVRSQGLELSLKTTWRQGIQTVASYTYQDRNVATQDDPVEPLNLNQAPLHQLSMGVSVARRAWHGSASLSWTDRAYWTDVLDQRFWAGRRTTGCSRAASADGQAARRGLLRHEPPRPARPAACLRRHHRPEGHGGAEDQVLRQG